MSSNPYFVIASQSDDLLRGEDATYSTSRPCSRGNGSDDEVSQVIVTGSDDAVENSTISVHIPSLRRNVLSSLLSRNYRRTDEEQCVPESTEQYDASCGNDINESIINFPDRSNPSTSSPPPSKENRPKFFTNICRVSSLAGRTAEVSEHFLRALMFDVLPWIVGCYVIFFAFRRGGLGLGFTAFLLLVSAHGVLKWWTVRGEEKTEHSPEEAEEEQDDSNTPSSNNHSHNQTPRCRHHHRNHSHHHHHHHRHNEDDSEDDYTTSDDDSDELFNSNNVVVVVENEPPPSYDAAANATLQDLSLGLEVHLKPKEPRNDLLVGNLAGVNGPNMYRHLLVENLTNIDEFRRCSVMSTTSYMSSEIDDESLPSYSDAVKKIKRRKKKSSRNKAFLPEERQDTECGMLIDSRNGVDTATSVNKGDYVRISVPPVSTAEDLRSHMTDQSSDIFSILNSAISSSSSLDSVPSYHSDPDYSSYRVSTTDSNSILFTEVTNRTSGHLRGSSGRHREDV